jgi:hypothetical protein
LLFVVKDKRMKKTRWLYVKVRVDIRWLDDRVCWL